MNRNNVIKSMFYKFTERLAVKGIGLIIGIILARLLMPEDFGQVAIITVFIALATSIIQGGLNTALVQQKDIQEDDYSTVFYISLAISVLMVIILFFSAPLIANFYKLPDLVWPIRVYSFSLLFGAFNSVQVAKIQREMNFKAMMWTSLIATVTAGIIGIALAYMGWEIWALVFYGCASTVLSCITMFFAADWFPRLTFSVPRAKILFAYGWKMLVSAILCSLYADFRSLLIGKKYSTDDLGYYNRGQQYPTVVSTTLDTTIQSVMFPTLARSQSDKDALKTMLKRTISMGAFIIVPTMLGLACVAEPLIRLLLTEKWLPATTYMQLICLAEASIIFTSSSLIAIKAMGRSDVYMKLEVARRIIMLAVLISAVVIFDSVLAIAVSYVISAWLDAVIIAIPLKRLLGYGFFGMIKDTWKSLLASITMCAVVFASSMLPLDYITTLFVQIITGVVAYVVLAFVLKINAFNDIVTLAKKILAKSNSKGNGVRIDLNNSLRCDLHKKELENCNFVKTILMIIVVVYHCVLYWRGNWFIGSPEICTPLSTLAQWFNSFHIYAFTFVSGYIFFYLKQEANKYNKFIPFVLNKAKRLLIPYVFVSVAWAIPIQLIFFDSSFEDIVKQYVLGTSPSQLWFLLMLFCVFIMFHPLSDFMAKYDMLGAAIILGFYGVGLIAPRLVPNVFQIATACSYIPLFYIGFKTRQYGSSLLRKIPIAVWLLADIAIFAVNLYIKDLNGLIYSLLRLGFNFALHIVGALMAFVILQKIAERINWKKNKLFNYLSKNSMTIYLFHQQIIYVCLYALNGLVNPYIHATINFIVAMISSSIISLILMKFKSTRILIGEK